LSEKIPKYRFLIYLLSFVLPLVGLAVGMVYYIRPQEEARRFGKVCLIVGISALILSCLSLIVWLAFFFLEIF